MRVLHVTPYFAPAFVYGGPPAAELRTESEHAALVVVGSRGRGGLAGPPHFPFMKSGILLNDGAAQRTHRRPVFPPHAESLHARHLHRLRLIHGPHR